MYSNWNICSSTKEKRNTWVQVRAFPSYSERQRKQSVELPAISIKLQLNLDWDVCRCWLARYCDSANLCMVKCRPMSGTVHKWRNADLPIFRNLLAHVGAGHNNWILNINAMPWSWCLDWASPPQSWRFVRFYRSLPEASCPLWLSTVYTLFNKSYIIGWASSKYPLRSLAKLPNFTFYLARKQIPLARRSCVLLVTAPFWKHSFKLPFNFSSTKALICVRVAFALLRKSTNSTSPFSFCKHSVNSWVNSTPSWMKSLLIRKTWNNPRSSPASWRSFSTSAALLENVSRTRL